MIKMWTLKQTFEFELTLGSDVLDFRLEIYERQSTGSKRSYKAKLLRWDVFDVHPAFTEDIPVATHYLLVTDVHLDGVICEASTLEEATSFFLSKLSYKWSAELSLADD